MGIQTSTLEVSFRKVTPEEAQHILATENYAGQRDIRTHHVSYLANELVLDRLAEGTKIHFAVCNGRRHLINGQHTLKAIDKAQKAAMLIIQETYCKTMEDVAHLFATEDRQLQRTVSDVYHAYNFAEEIGVSSVTNAGRLCAALAFLRVTICGLNSHVKPSPEDLMQDAHCVKDKYLNFLDAIHGHNSGVRKILERRALLAAALATMQHPKGFDFWNGMAADDGLGKYDPRKVCLNYMRDVSGLSVSAFSKKSEIYTPRYFFKWALFCFSKYSRNQEIKARNHEQVLTLNAVPGTPFDKGFNSAAYRRILE